MDSFIIIILLLILSAISKVFKDWIHHEKVTQWGDWWDPEKSWKFKYKNGNKEEGEKFFLSTTALVFLTDGWHFFQMLCYSFWQLAFAIGVETGYHWTLNFIVLKAGYSFIFESFYKRR